MHILGDHLDRRDALPADSLCEAALSLFLRDPDCRSIAVVTGDRPIGLVAREPFLARMEVRDAGRRPIRDVIEPDPVIADADEPAQKFLNRMLSERPAALLGGFIVTQGGAYEGVCDLARLAFALSAPESGLERARDDPGLIERFCAQAREPIDHAQAAAETLARMRLPDGAAAHVDVIAEAARNTLALLDIATELRQAEDGRLQITPGSRRLHELVDEVEARWQGRATEAGATLLVSYDGAPDLAAMVDSPRLSQVFDALIGHAIAHGGRGVIEASLQVRAADGGFELLGRVRDNAERYAPDYLDGLFRGRGASESGGMGLQLQLMLAARAIAAMHGSLEAKANPGPGATLAFRLTAAEAQAEGVAEASPYDAGAARAAHILVVDDNATNRMVVEALCEMFDCSTESVVDGIEAVEAAKAGRFDVILMDIKMPRMDGVTAAREIRKLPAPAGRVPIIALTANADADEVDQYLAAGMRSVVEKPIKPERLMEALDAALAGDDSKAAAAA